MFLKGEQNIKNPMLQYPAEVVVIGISTGGPNALQVMLPQLPADFPLPVIVAQHMPPGFTAPLAKRLDALCKMSVKEAENGEELKAGTIYIAPAGYQTEIQRKQAKLSFKIAKKNVANIRYSPSVDVTLTSIAKACISCMSVIMTGMGNDGLEGVRKIKSLGGIAIAQSEETCVVFGMPRVIIEAGLADKISPLENIPQEILKYLQRR